MCSVIDSALTSAGYVRLHNRFANYAYLTIYMIPARSHLQLAIAALPATERCVGGHTLSQRRRGSRVGMITGHSAKSVGVASAIRFLDIQKVDCSISLYFVTCQRSMNSYEQYIIAYEVLL